MSLNSMIFKVFLLVAAVPAAAAGPDLLDLEYRPLASRDPVNLAQRHAGQVLLVVNTASKCGFTPQYEGLEALHQQLGPRGFSVVGFPSNDFGEQEPGTEKEIADFCRLTYGVEFPMVGKTVVKGKDANPFYVKLAQITDSKPKWNFHKYLINRDATQVVAYSSFTKPDDKDLLKKIDEFLK